MKKCSNCIKSSLYQCKPCRVTFCAEHKEIHIKGYNNPHEFNKLPIPSQLSSLQVKDA